MIGGAQGNYLFRSLDGGSQWYYIPTDEIREFGPFLTRLSTSYQDPDVVYAISQKGVHKSSNFGGSWETTEIVDNWGFLFGSDVEVSQANPRFVWAGGRMKLSGTTLPVRFLFQKIGVKLFYLHQFLKKLVLSPAYIHIQLRIQLRMFFFQFLAKQKLLKLKI